MLLWRIGRGSDEFQAQSAVINKTTLGGYLRTPHSFVAMTCGQCGRPERLASMLITAGVGKSGRAL